MLITDDAYQAGLARLRAAAATQQGPVIDTLDLLVLRADRAIPATGRGSARLAPGMPITNPAPCRADPWRALFDCSVAETTLGWRPSYRRSEYEQIQSGAHP